MSEQWSAIPKSEFIQARRSSFENKKKILTERGIKFIKSGPYIESVVMVMKDLDHVCPQTGLKLGEFVQCCVCGGIVDEDTVASMGHDVCHLGCAEKGSGLMSGHIESDPRVHFRKEELWLCSMSRNAEAFCRPPARRLSVFKMFH